MQDYDALKTKWAGLSGSITEDLTMINAEIATPESTDEKTGQVTAAVMWTQANGWHGPINQNDLVAAGIITDAQRIDYECEAGLITQEQADSLKAWAAKLAPATSHVAATKLAQAALDEGITPLPAEPSEE